MKLNRAEFVFKAIDVICERPQNAVHYPNIVRVQNLAYSDKDEELTTGDLYFRRDIFNDGTKHPIMLYIHGGGFIEGGKKYRVTNSEFFAHHGYYVFNIDYRMPPKVSLSENFEDIVNACNYIDELAKVCNIDTDKIVVSGDSSGAHQTAMFCAFANDDELRKRFGLSEINHKPAALALMCGIYDFQKLTETPNILGMVSETMSTVFGFKVKPDLSNATEYEHIDDISPIDFVNDKWCPVFITWAADDVFCIDQGEPMAEALEKNGINTDKFVVNGFFNNHCYHLNMSLKIAKKCMNKCVHFLNDILQNDDHMELEEEKDD